MSARVSVRAGAPGVPHADVWLIKQHKQKHRPRQAATCFQSQPVASAVAGMDQPSPSEDLWSELDHHDGGAQHGAQRLFPSDELLAFHQQLAMLRASNHTVQTLVGCVEAARSIVGSESRCARGRAAVARHHGQLHGRGWCAPCCLSPKPPGTLEPRLVVIVCSLPLP